MSIDNAVAFLAKIRDDHALQSSLSKLDLKDFSSLQKAALAAGFPSFTQDEYLAAAKMRSAPPELSEAELDQISGGGNPAIQMGWCWDPYWGWYSCGYNYGVS